MPSKHIVVHTRRFLRAGVAEQLPRKLRPLFHFGVRAFVLQPLVSCNSNARMSHAGNRFAAEQRMYRLLHHTKLPLRIWQAAAGAIALNSRSLVNIDYSNLGPLAILGFAMQTGKGRATPVLMRALASNTQGFKKTHPRYKRLKEYYAEWKKTVQADQFTFVAKSLRLLKYLYRCQPRLVMDRGFVNKTLVRFLVDEQWMFYIRMRGDFIVAYGGAAVFPKDFAHGSYTVEWAGRTLRLVVGRRRERDYEPWYILTNDHTTKATEILCFYYHRFEIEESFRDLKSLFKLKYARLRTWQSLSVVLCFMGLALICALLTPAAQSKAGATRQGQSAAGAQTKKSLSIIRVWQETTRQTLKIRAMAAWGFG